LSDKKIFQQFSDSYLLTLSNVIKKQYFRLDSQFLSFHDFFGQK